MAKILAIDDKEDNLISLSAVLKSLIPGCTVITARSGPEGIEKAKIESPDTILLDIKMPGMDGYEICKRLKEDKDTRYIPVIMISAILTGSQDLIKGLDIGADAYLAKPVDEQVLIAQVKTALRMKTAEDTFRRQKDLLEEMVRERTAELVNSNVQLKCEIEERKKAEETLKESEKKYRSLFEQSNDAIIIHDLKGDIIDFNKRALEISGYDHEQLQNMNIAELHPEEALAASKKAFQETTEKGHTRFETRFRKSDGTVLEVEISSRIIDSVQKRIVQGIIRDITERKRAEEALRKNEERFRDITHSMADWVWEVDKNGKYTYVSNTVKNILRYSSNELIGKTPFELMPAKEGAKIKEMFLEIVSKSGSIVDLENWNLANDGTEVCLLTNGVPIINADGECIGYRGVDKDITRQKQLEVEKAQIESQLHQAQKMEAVGVLAGGVAHDFNNILTTVLGNAGLALMRVGKDDNMREEIEEIKKAGEKASTLTRQLLAFSRKQVIQPKILDLNELSTDIEKMLGRLIGEDVELLTIPGPALWQLVVDPGQMEQVIMNLVINARDAMPLGGKITIETANTDLDESYFHEHSIEEQPGSYVMLAVTDNGSGMDKETQEHIFEPFYTTKEKGKGTGLGLSTAYGIVKQNNGFIWVYSEPGMGSTFKVYLPKAKDDVALDKRDRIAVTELGGSEAVLIVEDDDSLRKVAHKALQQHGYRVLVAENGEDALKVSEAHDGPISLMITDVVMPKMSGKKTAEQLQPLYPHMKVLYMSGYPDDAIVHHGVLAPGLNFLEKPFTPEGLALKVREVLDEAKASAQQ